ncbi:hypothetical protein ILP97_38555 [Amycolatopsis sp. H6(2020)]|nr:hypothetical protein [Amycolatopsis sp. H6(2020)]
MARLALSVEQLDALALPPDGYVLTGMQPGNVGAGTKAILAVDLPALVSTVVSLLFRIVVTHGSATITRDAVRSATSSSGLPAKRSFPVLA